MQPTGLNSTPELSALGTPSAVLALAEAARWRGPDVTVALAEHAVRLASADGDRASAVLAEGWLAHGQLAIGYGWAAAPRAAVALGQAQRLGLAEASGRLRVELATLARALDAPGPARALLDPVLERAGLSVSLRADACLEAALAPDRPERESAELLDEAVAAFGQLGGEAGLLGLAYLDGSMARRHRERGQLSSAIARARDGLGKVLGDRLAGGSLEPVSPRLALLLCGELCVALADSGNPGPIREIAAPMLRWSLTPATVEPASVLRLILASRVHWPAREQDAALAEAGRVAAAVEGRPLPELEAESHGLLAEIHEARRALTEALAHGTRAHDALRLHGSRVEQGRSLLTQLAREQSRSGATRRPDSYQDGYRATGTQTQLPADSLLARVTEPVRNGYHAPTVRVQLPEAPVDPRTGHPNRQGNDYPSPAQRDGWCRPNGVDPLEPLPPPRPVGDPWSGWRRASALESSATESRMLEPVRPEPEAIDARTGAPTPSDPGHEFDDLLAGTPLDSARPAPPPSDTMRPDQIFAKIADDGEFAGWALGPPAKTTPEPVPAEAAEAPEAMPPTYPDSPFAAGLGDPSASPITGRRRRPEPEQPREPIAATSPVQPVRPRFRPAEADDDLDVLWLSPEGAGAPPPGPTWLTPAELGDRLTELSRSRARPPAHLVVVDLAAADDDAAALAEVAARVAERVAEQVPPEGQLFLMEPVTVTVALVETDQQAVSRWVRAVSTGLTQNWGALSIGAPRAMFRVAVRPLDRAWSMSEHVRAVEQRLRGGPLAPRSTAVAGHENGHRSDATPVDREPESSRGRHGTGSHTGDTEPPTTRFEARPGSGGRRRRPEPAEDTGEPARAVDRREPPNGHARPTDGLAGFTQDGLRFLRGSAADEPGPDRRPGPAHGDHLVDPAESTADRDVAHRTDAAPAGEPAVQETHHGSPQPEGPRPAADSAAPPSRPPAYDRPVSELTFAELIDGALAAYREA